MVVNGARSQGVPTTCTDHVGMANVLGHRADGRERLQGELTVTRSIGDVPYRHVGLTAEPEFTPWRSVQDGAHWVTINMGTLLPLSSFIRKRDTERGASHGFGT